MKSTGAIFFISFVLMANLRNTESKKMTLEEVKGVLQPLRKHCIERVGTDPKMIDNAIKGNFVPDRKLQCYYKCMMINTKVMRNDKIIERALEKIVDSLLVEDSVPFVLKAVEACHSVATKSMEGCELAYEYVKCGYDYDPTMLFYP